MNEQNCQDTITAHERFIEWLISGGMSIDHDGAIQRKNISELARTLGISRQTIYNWMDSAHKHDSKIRTARYAHTQLMIAHVWNGVYLKACDGDTKAAEMILSHFSDYKLPNRNKSIAQIDDNWSQIIKKTLLRVNAS